MDITSANLMDITSSGVMNITTSRNNSNISIEPHGTGITIGSSGGGNNAVNIDAKAFNIDAYSNSSNITLASSANGQDLTIGLTGNVDSSLILSSTGTGTDALKLSTTVGGIDIDSTTGFTLDATTISIDATDDSNLIVTNSDKDLTLPVVGGGTQVLSVNSAGTGTNAIDINATAGGIDIDASGVII